jgi:ABC-type methionine transport system ATPase subunit
MKTLKESKRYWLTFSAALVQRPLLWEMSRKFDLIYNIRSANVTSELGIVAVELTGNGREIDKAVQWLKRRKVQIDPI